jgi:DNA ligase-1
MRRFTDLYLQLDATTRTGEKVAALAAYFRGAPDPDAAWALRALTGRRLIRAVPTARLRQWVSEVTGYPPWLVNESYDAVGDLSETLALLLPEQADGTDEPLHAVVEQRVLPLAKMDEVAQRRLIVETWARFDTPQRLVFHKLISGAFRVGVSARLVTRALADVAGVDPAVMAHRLTGRWEPTAAAFRRLISHAPEDGEPGRPYPFFLASPLEQEPAGLGERDEWQAEWKWDGIRVQVIHRQDQVLLWSRGEELITSSFPDVAGAARALPEGTVLDGEVLAWEHGPLPFGVLQQRLGRQRVEPKLFHDVPVVFMAYDLLERQGHDVRDQPLDRRRAWLAAIIEQLNDPERERILLSPTLDDATWSGLAQRVAEARQRGVEGLMLKHRQSAYHAGRPRGNWWKWKVDPLHVDAVLISAEHGHGKRAGLFTDYTFALWREGELVPVAKAYSGLTHEEIEQVDRWVRQHTTTRHGRVRRVEPRLVFELAFEAVQPSTRHKSGLAVRFPRIARWRHDKRPDEADHLETLRGMLPEAMSSRK